MRVSRLLFFCTFYCSSSLIPKSLNGKKIMLNGPSESKKISTRFDGAGCITSIVFEDDKAIVSEAQIPYDEEMKFPLSDYLERDYFKILSKLPYTFLGNKYIQSGTRNTAVQMYNGKYYAVEESCRPVRLYYDNNIIKVGNKSETIDRMAAHLLDDNTIFSYTMFDKHPIKVNNTLTIPWSPLKQPAVVHDGVNTYDNKYYIFPITSTGMGRMQEYINGEINVPFDDKLNKAGWLVYDKENHECKEIFMDEYVDLFHISHIEHVRHNIHDLYAPFIYNFTSWVSTDNYPLKIKLKKVRVDLTENEIVQCEDTNISMDFIHIEGKTLIGSSLTKQPQVIYYDIETNTERTQSIPGENVREIIPFGDMLMYFSHENNNTRTYFYIISKSDSKVLEKIIVPNRPPGFHTTIF